MCNKWYLLNQNSIIFMFHRYHRWKTDSFDATRDLIYSLIRTLSRLTGENASISAEWHWNSENGAPVEQCLEFSHSRSHRPLLSWTYSTFDGGTRGRIDLWTWYEWSSKMHIPRYSYSKLQRKYIIVNRQIKKVEFLFVIFFK